MLFTLNQEETVKSTNEGSLKAKTAKAIAKKIKIDDVLNKVFPTIENGADYPFSTGAQWSTHDLVFHILSIIGPAEMTACTWSVAESVNSKLVDALEKGLITKISFLVDWRVQVRNPSFLAVAKQRFSDIRVSSCHAKAFTLINNSFSISCVCSSNFTNNPRIEAGHLSTSPIIANFHKEWIMAEINNAKPFGVDMRKISTHDERK